MRGDFGRVPLCNHRADRGIFIHGFCLPLCARCTGILAGAVIGTIIIRMGGLRLPAVPGILLIIPTAIDGAVEYLAGIESNNPRRLITGFLAGFGCAIVERAVTSALFT